MVERRPDPRDRRIWRLHLSGAAQLVLRDIHEQRAEMAAMVTRGVDEASQVTMIEALLRMKTTLTRDSHAARRTVESRPGEPRPAEAREAV